LKPQFVEMPILSNDRLILRSVGFDEILSIIEISVYNGKFAKNEEEAIHILKQINADVANGESFHWGIYLKEESELVGTCGYYRGFADNIGEIGYLLKISYRGLGIMTEAVKLIVDFGFDRLRLKKVVGYTSMTNPASIAVLKRVGFKKVRSHIVDLKSELSHM